MSTPLRKAALTTAILVVAFAGAAYMMANRVTPERAPVEEVSTPVEVVSVERDSQTVVVSAQGTVTPAMEVRVRPEVSGRIVERSPRLVPGGHFRQGQTLLRVDDRDYRVALTRQQQAVASAELALRQEKARKAVAEDEWELLEDSVPSDPENRDLALRIPQIEQARASVAAAQGTLLKAQIDLERCAISAPFNALVVRESVDLGQVINPQTEVATLVGTDYYWVQVALPVEDLMWIDLPGPDGRGGSPATITSRSGSVEIVREGHVERLLGDVDPAGRLARLLIVIEDPMNLKHAADEHGMPLLLGSFVTVRITGRVVDDVIVVPRQALRTLDQAASGGAEDGLWIMTNEDRLEMRPVEVVWRDQESVLVRGGVSAGERLVTSAISTPIAGMRLETARGTRSEG